MKAVASRHKDGTHVTPSNFEYLGPGTALRESGIEFVVHRHRLQDHRSSGTTLAPHNLDDVCFGCDGACNDSQCDSKRSSRVSADIESACDTSGCVSPAHGHLVTSPFDLDEKEIIRCYKAAKRAPGVTPLEITDNNINKNPSSTSSSPTKRHSDKNGNSQASSPVKRTQHRSPKSPPKSSRSPKSPRSPRNKGRKGKRLHSNGDVPDESPTKKGNTRRSQESLASDSRRKGSRVGLVCVEHI